MAIATWQPGTQVGPYRVVRSLGAGGFGEVFLAEDERLSRRVAIKRVRADDSTSAETRRRILREARAAAALSHPCIATVYDVIEDEQAPCIVMEYVDGGTLASRLSVGPLSRDETQALGVRLADALATAHGAGIVHRDLKPGNVVLMSNGRPKILDFGLAGVSMSRQAVAETRTAETGFLAGAGSPAYIPPECLRGALCDERGDIYSLGVTLYESVVGSRPFQGGTAPVLAAAVLAGLPRPDAPLHHAAGDRLADIIERAMAASQAERFESAAEFRDALATLAPQPITSSQPGAHVAQAGASGWKRRLALLAVLVGAAALAWATWFRPPAARANAEVLMVAPFNDSTGGFPQFAHVAASVSQMALAAASRSADLHVVRSKSFDGGSPAPIESEAREQGASLVLSGSVQAQPPRRLRILLTMVRPKTGVVVWSGQLEGEADDFFSLQDPLESRVHEGLVAASLPVRSETGATAEALATTRNQAAYNAYVRGRGLMLRRDVAANLPAAIAAFEDAIAADPSFARAHAGLAEAAWSQYVATDDQSWVLRAQQAIDEAVRLAPMVAEVRYVRALILQGRGHNDAAIDDLRSVLRVEERNDDAHRLLADILSRKNEHDAAVAEVRRAIELRPAFWEHHATLGLVEFRAGRFAEAADAFRVITTLLPESDRGYTMMCAAQMAGDQLDAARESCERAMTLNPNDGDSIANLATIQFWQGRYREAHVNYERAVALRPTDALYRRNLGDALAKLGRSQDAQRAWREAASRFEADLRVNPADHAKRSDLAVVQSKLGDCARAEKTARSAADREARSPDVRYNLGAVLALCGQPDAASRELEQALALGYPPIVAKYDPDLATARRPAPNADAVH